MSTGSVSDPARFGNVLAARRLVSLLRGLGCDHPNGIVRSGLKIRYFLLRTTAPIPAKFRRRGGQIVFEFASAGTTMRSMLVEFVRERKKSGGGGLDNYALRKGRRDSKLRLDYTNYVEARACASIRGTYRAAR